MLFWELFFLGSIFVYISGNIFATSCRRVLIYLYILVIWFIGAFRLNIGADYSTYEMMYNSFEEIYVDGVEPTFSFIVFILKQLSFNSQMLFVVYETIIIFFLYIGVKKYCSSYVCRLIFLVLYVIVPVQGGYWWDLNGVRQAATVSVSFLSSGFFLSKKYFYFLLAFVLAILFHYSAIIFIILFLYRKRFPFRIVAILLALGFIFNFTGITSKLVMQFIVLGTEIAGKYEDAIFLADVGTKSFSLTAVYLSILYFGAVRILKKEKISFLVFNSSSIYILLRVYMSFGIENSVLGSVLHRFEVYFLPLFLVFLSISAKKIIYMYKMRGLLITSVIAILLVIATIQGISKESEDVMAKIAPGASAGNIEYDFNFDLFK